MCFVLGLPLSTFRQMRHGQIFKLSMCVLLFVFVKAYVHTSTRIRIRQLYMMYLMHVNITTVYFNRYKSSFYVLYTTLYFYLSMPTKFAQCANKLFLGKMSCINIVVPCNNISLDNLLKIRSVLTPKIINTKMISCTHYTTSDC